VDIEQRIQTASAEMKRAKTFDYMVVNNEVSQAMADVESIITAEKCRAKSRKVCTT
jgi:guanylate kinase